MLTVGSLFAGIGGFDLGFERAGFTIAWQVEIDPFCRAVLAQHWPDVRRYADVRRVGRDLAAVDVICGGFPCQPHSLAGRRLGADDERDLWPEFVRLIRELRPRWVVAENVPGLLSSDAGRFFGTVLGDLAASGYDAEWDCIPAAAVGAPHLRDRVWLLAYPRGLFGHRPDDGSRKRYGLLPQGNRGRTAAEWGVDRELVALVPGIHPRTPADWWGTQSRMDRSAAGVPDQMDRVKALGNAIVPQIAEWIARHILEAEGLTVDAIHLENR